MTYDMTRSSSLPNPVLGICLSVHETLVLPMTWEIDRVVIYWVAQVNVLKACGESKGGVEQGKV
jgi:hypothetical protein